MKKRILSLLLILLLGLGMVPAAAAAPAEAAPAPGGEASVRDAIFALEAERLNRDAAEEEARDALARSEDFYAGLIADVEGIVAAQEDYVPGTLLYEGGILYWETTDGVTHGYNPARRAEQAAEPEPEPLSDAELAELAEALQSRPEREEGAELMSFDGTHYDTAFFSPHYNEKVGIFRFNLTAFYKIQAIAAWTGGNYEAYFKEEATIDRIAAALQNCCVVVLNSHGDKNNRVELTSNVGLTSADYKKDEGRAYGNTYHAVDYIDGGVVVDGVAIANHMTGPGAGGLFLACYCHSMENQAMEAPLRAAGVGTVFGFSRSVQHDFDDKATEEFLTGISKGYSIAMASQYMRERLVKRTGLIDRSVVYWDPWVKRAGDLFSRTEEEARDHGAAFIWITSDADPYPTGAYGTQCKQAVTSNWTVPYRPTAGTEDIEIVAPVGTEFRKFFGNARTNKIEGVATLLHPEQLPETVGIGATYDVNLITGDLTYYSYFAGRFTTPGYWESEVALVNGSGQREVRTVRLMAWSDEPSETVERSSEWQLGWPGMGWTVLDDGKLYQADLLSGSLPEGTFLSKTSSGAIVLGYPKETGVFKSKWRVVGWDGVTRDLCLTLTVRGEATNHNQTVTERVGQNVEIDLETGDDSGVYSLELLEGELPPGFTLNYSQSEAPCIQGSCDDPGEYTVMLRIVTGRFQTVVHTIHFSFYWVQDKYKNLNLDLTGGTAYLTAAQYERVWRNLLYAGKSGQIAAHNLDFDLDGDGSQDLRLDRNFHSVTLLYGNSLSGDTRVLKMSEDTRRLLHDDGLEDWYEQLTLRLTEYYPLWIDGVQVTNRNRADVLGNGVFRYDGAHELAVRGDYTGTTTEPLISTEVYGLTVRVEADSVLKAKDVGFLVGSRTTVTGPGLLFLKAGGEGVSCDGQHSNLTVTDAALRVEAGGGALFCHQETWASALTIDHSELQLKGGVSAVDGFSSITLYRDAVKKPRSYSTVGGTLRSDGTVVKEATITAWDEAWDLTIGGVQVTDRNRLDVLGDGAFLFDGADTLYVKGSYSGGPIECAMPKLNICASQDTELSSDAYCVLCLTGCEAVISGGPLTLKTSWDGDGAAIWLEHGRDSESGEWLPSKLTLSDMTLNIDSACRGVYGRRLAAAPHEVVIDHSDSDIRAVQSCVKVWGDFAWSGCDLTGADAQSDSGWVELVEPEDGSVPATHAVFSANRHYGFHIDGLELTERSLDLLPAAFSYDPITNVLTVKGDYTATVDNVIWNEENEGLTIRAAADAVLTGPDGLSALYFQKSATLTGPGTLTLTGSHNTPLSVYGNAEITLNGATLIADGALRGLYGYPKLILKDAQLTATAKAGYYAAFGAVYGFGGGIELTDCALLSPAGGTVEGGTVRASGGEAAAEVRIGRTGPVADPADMNGDGLVNAADAALLFAHVSGDAVSFADTAMPDVNADGKVNNKDAMLLFRRML